MVGEVGKREKGAERGHQPQVLRTVFLPLSVAKVALLPFLINFNHVDQYFYKIQ